jgi:rubrerythrin
MNRKFTRTIEDFTCANCGTFVKGDGYTDHCPNCLWSKHVDVNPGDRAAECEGMLEPVAVELNGDIRKIHYVCTKCGHKHRVRTSPEDSFEVIVELSGQPLRRKKSAD